MKLRVRDSRCGCGLSHVPQKELGEREAAASIDRIFGDKWLERKYAARELVPQLVEILPVVFESEIEGMLTMDPGKLVHELQGVVVVFKRPVVRIAYRSQPAKAIKYDIRNSPSERSARGLARNADRRNYVPVTGA